MSKRNYEITPDGEWFNSVNEKELLSKAIKQCKEIDSKNPNLRKIL